MSKSEKTAENPQEPQTPGTLMAENLRARANKLTDAERALLLDEAMRIIYGPENTPIHAHSR